MPPAQRGLGRRRSWTASTGCATPTARRRPPSCATRCSGPCRKTPRCSAPTGSLAEGCATHVARSAAELADIKVTDRSMIWNSDLVETLELENLMANAHRHRRLGRGAQGEPRRARARGLRRTATTRTGASTRWRWSHPDDSVTLSYRPVHTRAADHRGRGRHRPEEDRAQGAGVLRRPDTDGRTHAAPQQPHDRPGKTWPKPEGATNVREFRIYRWRPGRRRATRGSTPTSSTSTICGPMVLDALI